MATIRAFLAVSVEGSTQIRSVLRKFSKMGRAVRAVSPDGLHLTLKFFGDIDVNDVSPVSEHVQLACRDAEPFDLRLKGLGAFPHLKRPSVIWAGVEDGEPLVTLAERIIADVENLGFPREQRSFIPHLTLARIKQRPPGELSQLVESHAATVFAECPINAVHLYQSELKTSGPIYTKLASFSLGES